LRNGLNLALSFALLYASSGEILPFCRCSMIASSLQAIISQTLLKRTGGGRVAAHEILIGTGAVRNMIKENKIPQMHSALQTGAEDGMQTLDQSLHRLVTMGHTTREIAAKKAKDPTQFMTASV